MKYKLLLLVITAVLISACSNNQVKFHGKIEHLVTPDHAIVLKNQSYSKKIKVDEQGNFSDAWELKKDGIYKVVAGNKNFSVFLKPGYDLHVEADADHLDNTLKFTGKGAATNNFIVQSNNKYRQFVQEHKNLLSLDKKDFDAGLTQLKTEMDAVFDQAKGVDEYMLNKVKNSLKKRYANLRAKYRIAHTKNYTLEPGTESPKFFDLEQYGGGTVSMDDLKGNFLYIDVWATWCGPCKREIPHMKKLVDEYAGKNIRFISISSDRPTAHSNWEKMVEEKGMKGIQLFMGKDKSFAKDYNIRSIPRFIFVDPDGNIVNANAPRPSQHAAVTKMFEEAGVK